MSREWEGGSDSRWRAFRLTILERDRYRCQIQARGCTTLALPAGGHVDHIVPLSRGGAKYDPSNCRAACPPCNTSRSRALPKPQPQPRRVSSW